MKRKGQSMQRESPAAWDMVERKMEWKKRAWSLFWGRSENDPYASSFFKTEKEKKKIIIMVEKREHYHWFGDTESMNWDHDPKLTPLPNELKPQSIWSWEIQGFYPEPQDHIWQAVNIDLYPSAIQPAAFESRSYNQLKAKLGTLHSTTGLLSLLHEKLLIAVPCNA